MVIVPAGGSKAGNGKTDNGRAFNACIARHRFLVLTTQASGGRIVETIRDRADMHVAGRFAVLPSVRAAEAFAGTLSASGSGAVNGRMVLLTAAAVGQDADAIWTCAEPEFPGP